MKKRVAIVMICAFVCITGCSNNERMNEKSSVKQEETSEKVTSIDTYNEYVEIFASAKDDNDYSKKYAEGNMTVKFNVVNRPENNTLYYNGNDIQLEIQGSAGFNTTLGCMIYINGIPQKYHTDKEKEKKYLHSFSVEKEQNRSVILYVSPNIGKSGDELNMNIVPVVGSAYRPLGPHDAMKPECDAKMLLDQYKVIMNTNSNVLDASAITDIKNVEYTKNELDELIFTRADGSIENRLEQAAFRNSFTRNVIEDNGLRLFSEFGGGSAGEYIVSAYLNGKVLKMYRVNLQDYNSRAIVDDTIAFTAETLIEYDIQDYNSFYYIAVPVNNKTNGGKQIQSDVGIVVSGKDVLE